MAVERLGEWVRDSLHIVGVAPNHGWRHLFKAVARHVEMDREVEGFITGHGTGSVSERYGPRWPKTLAKAVNMYPRFRIAALKEVPAPHKRIRRTRAQILATPPPRKDCAPSGGRLDRLRRRFYRRASVGRWWSRAAKPRGLSLDDIRQTKKLPR